VAPDLRATIVARAEGAPGRAVVLLEDPHAEARQRMLDQLGRLTSATAADLSAVAQALGRDDAGVALETVVSWYRDVLALAVDGPDAPVRNADTLPALRLAATHADVPQVLRALETVCDTIRTVERNANKVLALETMLLSLRQIDRTGDTY